ncbi:18397_t:CDS:2 [Racocetra persica]|uniref:18397_t:CDS:1 n=2 Tax=Racocetra persica TaxID=160502 RepID=A0ACA9KG29_9GLOM|nr:18396_t:CDS:2 [Racocetra persica]CAG8468324.1 18397_t:CDS:2 [Racocetra persica]
MRTFIKTQLSQLDQILQLEKEHEDSRIRMRLRQLKQQLEITNRKILEAETAEDKKAYLYKTISALTETKDAMLWKKKDLVKDLEEEYGYATNQALTLDRKNFEAIEKYEQRILIERLAKQMEPCENEPL